MNRNEMKSLVKECLLEILRDGIGSVSTPSQSYPYPQQGVQRQQKQIAVPQRQHPSNKQVIQNVSHLKETIRREAGGNRVMESILADTAASTLPKMLQNDTRTPQPQAQGLAERVVASTTPEEIFGDETTSRWADLAFMGNSKGR